jgi:prepilin-type processing-associated H-X9-DG protein
VQNYEQAKHSLPAAGSFPPAEQAKYFDDAYWRIDLRQGQLHGWMVHLLPYIEQQALHQQFDFKAHLAENPLNPQAAQPATLLCASDDAIGRQYEYLGPPNPTAPVLFGKGNYAGFAGPFHTDGWDYRGAIWLYGVKMKDVIDGTASTLVLGEIRTRDHVRDQRGAWALPWAGSSLVSVDMHYPAFGPNQEADITPDGYVYDKASFGFTQRPNSDTPDVLYACPEPAAEQLEAMPCTTDYGLWRYISAAPRSHHPQGVHVAYLDGHVAFMANTVDEISLAYQAAINDEQLITDPPQ